VGAEPSAPVYVTEIFEIADDVTVPMVLVQPGTFTMGSPNGEEDDQPLHRVTISVPFYLGKFEVTQRQWVAVMGSNPSRFQGDDLPVEQVTWADAQEFIKRLNAQTGGGWRLPTEAEWEYACRTGSDGDYAGQLDAVAWYAENSRGRTHPVGTKIPNAGGLFDMHGNVLEWCQDWHAAYTADDKLDPVRMSGGVCKIVRGGSWNDDAEACRSGYRFWLTPDNANALIGLRLARNADSGR
jgi:formylglycine-generating enzyme required for sulfatase activity